MNTKKSIAWHHSDQNQHRQISRSCILDDSRIFQSFPADLMKDLTSQPLTVNAHKWSLSVEVRLLVNILMWNLLGLAAPGRWTRAGICFNWTPHMETAGLCRLQTFNAVNLLSDFYKVVSTNTDGKVEFVSTMEGSHTLWAQIYLFILTLKGAALMMGSFFPVLRQRTTTPSTALSGIRRRRPTCGHVPTSHTLGPQSGLASTQRPSSSMKV